MAVRVIEKPPSHRYDAGLLPLPTRQLLEAVRKVRERWPAAGRGPITQGLADGRTRNHPSFSEEVRADLQAIKEAAEALPPERDLTVESVLEIKEQKEKGRLVCRAIVCWSDGTVGEALAW